MEWDVKGEAAWLFFPHSTLGTQHRVWWAVGNQEIVLVWNLKSIITVDEIWERGKTRKKQESRDSKNQGHYELSLLAIIRDCANELSKSLFSCLIQLEKVAEKAEQIIALKYIICIFSKINPEFCKECLSRLHKTSRLHFRGWLKTSGFKENASY